MAIYRRGQYEDLRSWLTTIPESDPMYTQGRKIETLVEYFEDVTFIDAVAYIMTALNISYSPDEFDFICEAIGKLQKPSEFIAEMRRDFYDNMDMNELFAEGGEEDEES